MFLNNFTRRKLESLLRPWLLSEPELELNLGLINSQAIARNLRFDTSVLKELVDDPGGLCFNDVNIEKLIIRFSNWSVPAFSFEVYGFHVTLSVRNSTEERNLRQARKGRETFSESVKKKLSQIDPEGSILHSVLERMSATSPSRNKFKSAFRNLILRHCQLQIHNLNVQVQFPMLNDSCTCILHLNELNAESEYLNSGCLFRGLVGVVFLPVKESSYVISVSGFEIGFKVTDQVKTIVLSTDLFIYIKLNDFQLIDFNLRVPELSISFSPADIFMYLALGEISPKESQCAKNGRQLWRLAATGVGHVISAPRLRFYNLVVIVGLWLRYVNAYEHILQLVGYSADDLLKKSATKMSQNKKFMSAIKQYWKVISDIEKELPVESIVQARRIARYRAALNVQSVFSKESYVTTHVKFFCKILPLVGIIWNVILTLFHFIVSLLFFWRKLAKDPTKKYLEIVSDDPFPHFGFILNVGRILVNISHMNEIQLSEIEKLESCFGIPSSDLVSFTLSMDALLLKYREDVCEQSFVVSCGQFKVKPSSETPFVQDNSKKFLSHAKGQWEGTTNNMESILWFEPAQTFPSSETSKTSTGDDAQGAYCPFLENCLREMWSNWEQCCMQFEKTDIQCSENPFLLLETTSLLTYPGLKNSDSGFWKCFFSLGKFHLGLGCSSILSLSLILRQIQVVLCRIGDTERSKVFSHSPGTIENQPETSWDSRYRYYANTLWMTLFKMLPEKHIQLGVFIAGPCIKLSLEKEFSGGNKDKSRAASRDGFSLAFDIHNIEVAIWPTSTSDSSGFVEHHGCDDTEPECIRLEQPRIIDIPKSDNAKHISDRWIFLGTYLRVNGVSAYLGDLAEKQTSEIFVLQPVAVQFSSTREYFDSFSTNVIACSVALCITATGLTVLSYLDEFYVLSQVVAKLYTAVSYLLSSSVPSEIMGQKITVLESENEEAIREQAPSICGSIIFLMSGILKIKTVDVSLQKTKINNDMESSIKLDALSGKTLAELDWPDYGILISIQQTNVDISCEEERLEIVTDFSDIHSVVFGYQNLKRKSTDNSVLKDLLLQSHNCLYEISFSNCMLALSLFLSQSASTSRSMANKFDGPTSGSNTSYMDSLTVTIDPDMSSSQSSDRVQKLRSASNVPAADPSDWLFVHVVLGMVYIGSCSLKNALMGAHEPTKLLSSLSLGGEFEKITWGIQGGLLFLDTQALEKFMCCFSSYFCSITNILTGFEPKVNEKDERNVDMTRLVDHHAQEFVQETRSQANGEHVQALTINISQLSTVFLIEDEKGGVQELLFECDVQLNFELKNITRTITFDLKRLSTLSRVLQQSSGKEFQIPHFYSLKSNHMSNRFDSGDSISELQHMDMIKPLNDPSCSKDSESTEELSATNCIPEFLSISYEKHILKHLAASLLVQKHLNSQAWIGSGSISGFDIIVSLSEMEMILFVISSFSGILGKTTTRDLNKKQRLSNQEEFGSSLQEMVPNGSIVAIQDVHQHLYFAVDNEENKYNLVGTIHYSLVGERALFRIKYHQRRWRSSTLWFSLISLHAKNDLGEPFRLNYRPGSGFVDISSTDDGGWASWRILSCEPESYDSDIDWEPYNQLVKKTFYLVNKKNDCSVAFVDGVPEFVRKPGDPFKFKVFDDLFIARDVGKTEGRPLEDSRTSEQDNTSILEGKTSKLSGKLPCIDIMFDKISLSIVHEIPDTSDVFPLLRASIDNTQHVVQVLSAKTRVISSSTAAVDYFDSQRNSWKELLHPVEVFLFYRSSLHIQGSETNLHGVPVHIHCRTKELNMSLSELSLDILLFVIGKLSLAGPYSLKSSRILVNCCKVENQTGVNLLCHFFNKQSMKIARKQSTSIFFRYSDLAKQPAESASVSFKLAVPGSFTTSSIHLSLLQAQQLAWKTRIMSSQDSRTYPGPFVVVDISRESEDGLSIIVSPLIRIHNETKFSMELQFRRPHQKEDEFASVVLKPGDTIDDSMAMFDALHLSGGLKKALTSLSLGNFLFSFRPDTTEGLMNSKRALSVEWSDDLKGGKAVRLSGVFDKLGYKVRKALLNESLKCSFNTAQCRLKSEGSHIGDIHFLIQSIGRDVPVVQPNNSKEGFEYSASPVTLQEQKEIFILPTVKVFNLLQLEMHVILSETDACSTVGSDNTGNQATISCGSSVDFYVNPSVIYFTVTLVPYGSSCKPVNSSDWVKKLQKQKSEVHYLDIDLEFGNGNYFASLRLSRGQKGMLEATVFTSYALKNDSDFSLYFFAPNRKPLTRNELEELGYGIPPELGVLLPPKSTRSWFLKTNKVRLKLLEGNVSEALLDLDALSGLTEISLEMEDSIGVKSITKLGVSTGPPWSPIVVPSQLVTMVPRYVIANESEGTISVRQCYLQDDTSGIIVVNSKQQTTLQLWNTMSNRREFSFFETLIRKHKKANDDALVYIQFRPNQPELSWSGPVCIASHGRFFIKFRRQQSDRVTSLENVAAVHIVEEGSTLVLHYHRPPNVNLPYRIENCLSDVSITYYQKDSSAEPEVLGSENSADYVWDDLTIPHKLVVRINDSHSLREINLDKVREWKPFYKSGRHRGLAYHFLSDENPQMQMSNVELNSMEMVKVGYEVYADGPTRVLRFCEISKSHKRENVYQSCEKIKMRVPQFTIQLLEQGKQGGNEREGSIYTPIIAARFVNFSLDSLFMDQQKYNLINLQSLTLEQKWAGAPFAAMLRRHEVDNAESNDCLLRIVCVLLSTSSDVIQVQYSSIALQPIDLNLDEETLMKVVPFWRTSLSNSASRQYYFDHFEIQPIKIIANFLPGDSYSSYSSAQETMRSLLHSVIKVPPIKNMAVELNGVLVTHALITMRELCIRCAKHYSWYAMRAIYIAKGSPLLPPDFVSMFDDLASSSLDAFFDPSRGLMNLPGLTLGTFKFISKCIGRRGFSGTKRYFGDLGNSLRTAGSNVLFAAVSEISDSVLKGAEATGFNGMVTGFHQGILKLAMEPSLLGSALMEGGPDRKIKLDRSPGVDELYIEGYLQAMLDTLYRQEYLRVRVIDNQVYLKNLPPNNTLIEEIVDHVKGFLVSKALLKGDPSRTSLPLRHLRGENEWKLGPTLLTLCEHLFVSFAIRMLRNQANKFIAGIKWNKNFDGDDQKAITPTIADGPEEEQKVRFIWRWGIGRFFLSAIVAYVDGRLCRHIPNPIARRIVSGFLLTFLDKRSDK